MTNETWLPIPSYEGFYEASSLGRIRSVDRTVTAYSAKAKKVVLLHRKGRLLALSVSPANYNTVCLAKNGKSSTRRVAKLICSAFYGPCPKGMQTCHCNGNSLDDRAANLRWDTAKANQADRIKHGTDLRGVRIGTSKLTELEVKTILKSKSFGKLSGVLVSRSQYYRIKRGESWSHISAR